MSQLANALDDIANVVARFDEVNGEIGANRRELISSVRSQVSAAEDDYRAAVREADAALQAKRDEVREAGVGMTPTSSRTTSADEERSDVPWHRAPATPAGGMFAVDVAAVNAALAPAMREHEAALAAALEQREAALARLGLDVDAIGDDALREIAAPYWTTLRRLVPADVLAELDALREFIRRPGPGPDWSDYSDRLPQAVTRYEQARSALDGLLEAA